MGGHYLLPVLLLLLLGESSGQYDEGQADYGQSPVDYGQSPVDYGQSPVDYGQSPVDYGQSPVDYDGGQSLGDDGQSTVDDGQSSLNSSKLGTSDSLVFSNQNALKTSKKAVELLANSSDSSSRNLIKSQNILNTSQSVSDSIEGSTMNPLTSSAKLKEPRVDPERSLPTQRDGSALTDVQQNSEAEQIQAPSEDDPRNATDLENKGKPTDRAVPVQTLGASAEVISTNDARSSNGSSKTDSRSGDSPQIGSGPHSSSLLEKREGGSPQSDVSDLRTSTDGARQNQTGSPGSYSKDIAKTANIALPPGSTTIFRAPLPVFQIPGALSNISSSSLGLPGGILNTSRPVFNVPGTNISFMPLANNTRVLEAGRKLNTANLAAALGVAAPDKKSDGTSDLQPSASGLSPRPTSSLGQVSSPFFFLCHYPRHGEASPTGALSGASHPRLDDPQQKVTVALTVLGDKKLDRGYQPNVGYELGVSSSVAIDGFLVTGVLALTEEHAQALSAPTPPKGTSTEGRVCTVLHSQASRRAVRDQTFLWVAPAPGSGCVAFLATGSIGDTIVYKDINIFEVCEEESGPARLTAPLSLLSGVQPQPDLILRDTFDDRTDINQDIWGVVQGGNVRELGGGALGSGLFLSGSAASFVETRPLDLTRARDLHFSLSSGPCKEGTTVRLLFGSLEPPPSETQAVETVAAVSQSQGTNLLNLVDVRSSLTERLPIGTPVGRSSNPLGYIPGGGPGAASHYEADLEGSGMSNLDLMASDDPASYHPNSAIKCSYWTRVEEYTVSNPVRQVSLPVPPEHRRHDACVKLETVITGAQNLLNAARASNSSAAAITASANSCWILDDVALGQDDHELEVKSSISEDFDSLDSSNWLFFPGARVEKTCGSESNVLVFPELPEDTSGNHQSREFTTAILDLSVTPSLEDIVLSKRFTDPLPAGWNIVGSGRECSGAKSSVVLTGAGVRRLCTPPIDASRVGVIHLEASRGGCANTAPPQSQSSQTSYFVAISVYAERSLQRDSLQTVELDAESELFTIVVPPALQKNATRFCVEQSDLASEADSNPWAVLSLTLLPHLPANPSMYFQARVNLGCSSLSEHLYGRRPYDLPVEGMLEESTDRGITWVSLHDPCLPGGCPGTVQSLFSVIGPAYEEGWVTVTVPLPYRALTPQTRLRLRPTSDAEGRTARGSWALDNVFVGQCEQGCNGRGLCSPDGGACRCQFGFTGRWCQTSSQENPRYLAEPFSTPVEETANLLQVWGGAHGFQCGLVGGAGAAGVMKGWGLRSLTTIDVNTTDDTLLQLHFFGGTESQVGKCPGADHPSESVYLHHSCNGGVTWHLLHTLFAGQHTEPSHLSLELPPSARGSSCRFRLWQPQHSGAGRDMWAVDDLTLTSRSLNNIQLEFDNLDDANSSLRFHLGTVGRSCDRDQVLVFPKTVSDGLALSSSSMGFSAAQWKKRLLETKSLGVGPSFMMQFNLVIGCNPDPEDAHPLEDDRADLDNVVMLEYSLNHGLSWQLVQKPCSPSTPGCQSHFTRGTVYHSTEFNNWKRVTLRLPRHTWSPVTRLRLREGSLDENGEPVEGGESGRSVEWAVDDLYIGHKCNGHCSGHGRCTLEGCICDEGFHGQKCVPVHKLHRMIKADFDVTTNEKRSNGQDSSSRTDGVGSRAALYAPLDDFTRYDISLVGGQLAEHSDGCDTILSGKNVYFGAVGVRQLEVDDMAAEDLHSLQFHVTIGGAAVRGGFRSRSRSKQTRTCHRGEHRAGIGLSEGSVVVQYSTDGGLEWHLLHELVPDLYREPKVFRQLLPEELVNAESGVVRFRIWQPRHGSGDQWAIDNLLILPDLQSDSLQSDARSNALTDTPWLTITSHQRTPYCPEAEKIPSSSPTSPSKNTSLAAAGMTAVRNGTGATEDSDVQLLSGGLSNSSAEEGVAFVLNGPELVREAVTKMLNLSEGDVIYFMIKLGCAGLPQSPPHPPSEPVVLEYSTDGELTWSLVTPPCPPSALHCRPPSAPSVYRPEVYPGWTQVMVDVDHRLSMGPIELRWRQENPTGDTYGEFALKGVYAGLPCPRHCSGHGHCQSGAVCACHDGYTGKFCEKAPKRRLSFLKDDPLAYSHGDATGRRTSSSLVSSAALDASPWLQLEGSKVVTEACGPKNMDGPVLLFADDSPRLAVLKESDTRGIRALHFNMQIGSGGAPLSLCKEGVAPRDNVLVQYTTDAGLHWHTLAEIEPRDTVNRTRPFSLTLPPGARSRQTMFRWWQPDPLSMDDGSLPDDTDSPPVVAARPLSPFGGPHAPRSTQGGKDLSNDRAEWQLGGVMLLANDTLPNSLAWDEGPKNGDIQTTETWFLVRGGRKDRSPCHDNETLLVFKEDSYPQSAETWDVEATEATMVQFDLFGPCPSDQTPNQKSSASRPPPEQMMGDAHLVDSASVPSIAVEYSTNSGDSWSPVRELCAPPDTSCPSYDLGSVYNVPQEKEGLQREKRRVMLEMPRTILGRRLRVRFRKLPGPNAGGSWGLGNVFLGDSCPWMCSGHGYCNGKERCSCDPEYFGDVCVPSTVLPCELLDTFNQPGGSAGGRTDQLGSPGHDATIGLNTQRWWSVRGAKASAECGLLVADSALVFAGEGVREATTVDLDMTAGQFIQFKIMLGCGSEGILTKGGGANTRKRIQPDVPPNSWQRDGTSIEGDRTPSLGFNENEKGDGGLSARDEGILVQFSVNGGVNWDLLKEIHYALYSRPRFVNINLGDYPDAQTNSTRFRFWQPKHPRRYGHRAWALDNVYIGGSPIVPNVLYEDFNNKLPISDAWIDWPSSEVGQLCDSLDSRKSLVFRSGFPAGGGERALYSKDVSVYGDSVMQFDIKIGCGGPGAREPSSARNISLQYSTDNGASWRSLRETAKTVDADYLKKTGLASRVDSRSLRGEDTRRDEYYSGTLTREGEASDGTQVEGHDLQRVSPDCLHELRAPSVYYWNSAPQWRREVIPLSNLQICGNVRFRWVEGEHPTDPPQSWGLDNIYIGPSCIYHCNGHGHCINGDTCICDDGYDGENTCLPLGANPAAVKINFEADPPAPAVISRISGGAISSLCTVMVGQSLVFTQDGERTLLTKDLDLSAGSLVQFYLRLGCDVISPQHPVSPHSRNTPPRPGVSPSSVPHTEVLPILLQFSTDGGISWTLVAELTKDVKTVQGRPHSTHFTIPLPDTARTNATLLRWWQPSPDGTFGGTSWAIDELFIGSSSEALAEFSPPSVGSWLLTPGASLQPACGLSSPVLYFNGVDGLRFAETPDLVGTDSSYLQFMLVMGCSKGDPGCYGVSVEYSTDHGKHWQDWLPPSPPFPQQNPLEDNPPRWGQNIHMSDLHQQQSIETLPLPPLARGRTLRARFIQHGAPQTGPKETWALPHVYFGEACNLGCSSRGLCVGGQCQCGRGWTGPSCSIPTTPLPTFLFENFTGGAAPGNWRRLAGGSSSSVCSAGAVGEVLHFTGSCSRYLGSVDLDLRDAHYVQFHIVSGCNRGLSPSADLTQNNQRPSYGSQNRNPYANAYQITYQEPDLESRTSGTYAGLLGEGFDQSPYGSDLGSYSGFDSQITSSSQYQSSFTRNRRAAAFQQTRADDILDNSQDGRTPRSNLYSTDDSKILVQISCDGSMSYSTLKVISPEHIKEPTYVWLEIPDGLNCLGGRVRWWQSGSSSSGTPRLDWALDSVVIGGSRSGPPETLAADTAGDYTAPLWIKLDNVGSGKYCKSPEEAPVAKSSLTEPAIAQTTDIKVTGNTSLHFELSIGCDASWDKPLPPVSVEYSLDFGFTWSLVRSTCLPGDPSCLQLSDSSVFYGPLSWTRRVYPLEHVGPAKYVRFRWYQPPAKEVNDLHQWSLRNVYIGKACPSHCLGRGYCMAGVCYCDDHYAGTYCQHLLMDNVPFIRDTFNGPAFQPHWAHVQGGLHSPGCDGLVEEPPAVTLEGQHTRSITSVPVDTRSAKFVLFTAVIGGGGKGGRSRAPGAGSAQTTSLCRPAETRMHNVFLQYSVDGGIHWQLLRELDHLRYNVPTEDYVLIPPNARSAATLFRFWQPRQWPLAPSWSLDNVFIGGSEISAAQMEEKFKGEPQVTQWLFAPHSTSHQSYCSGNESALVWDEDKPGTRSITSQEIIVTENTVLQFKISIGCGSSPQCPSATPNVLLEYSKDGGSTPWQLVLGSCLPSGSQDSDCLPYVFRGPSVFEPDVYHTWTRVTIPMPEKTRSSTTQLRWYQFPSPDQRPVAWSLASVYVGARCPRNCQGRGDCRQGQCHCDPGYSGETCEPRPSPHSPPLSLTLIDGFEGTLNASWAEVLGGWPSRGCSSMAPYGNGKHLYFGGCGTRSAVTKVLDTRRAGKVIFVLRIGSAEGLPGCSFEPSDGAVNILDKGVVLQYSSDMGIEWKTINAHDPAEFRKARRVVYSLPPEARRYGVQLRWWQPLHAENADQWAIDNVEIDVSDPKDTSRFEVLHDDDTY